MKTYTVQRAFAAPAKGGGGEVYITRANENDIPDLLSASAIKEYVKSGALVESGSDDPEEAELKVLATREAESRSRGKRS
jgi:ribosomal protein L19E